MSSYKIPLNGSNYISPTRKQAFQEALEDNPQISSLSPSSSPPAQKPDPPAANTPQNGRTEERSTSNHDFTPTLQTGLEHSQAHQQRTIRVHETYLNQQNEYARIFSEVLHQQEKLLENGNSASLKETLQALHDSLKGFHHIQEKSLEIHQQFLRQQADYAQSFVRFLEQQKTDPGIISPQDNGSTVPRDIPEAPVSSPQTPAPEMESSPPAPKPQKRTSPQADQESAPGSQSISVETLQTSLLDIVAEKTGYPAEMLELEMDMEADLGIDSIKRVEILGALEDQYPSLPPADTEQLADLRTLEQVRDYMASAARAPEASLTEKTPPPSPPAQEISHPPEKTSPDSPSQTPSLPELASLLLEIVAEKTGYPAEMLELEMDMEADLGIDSIKRVEILGAMEDQVPELPSFETEKLAELRTLQEIVEYMTVEREPSTTEEKKKPTSG
jgi:acyl carrier protein